jgi:sigma-B regulation protein RsbU (phosphoserine phosphatase)
VSGKGVVAAFFMLRAHHLLLEIIRQNDSPAQCLRLANLSLCEANPLTLFVTVFFGILDVKTSTITYASGGHNMPLLLNRDGVAKTLPRAAGMLLGCFEEAEFSEETLVLDPDDRLFLFTDGLTEAMNAQGHWFGDDQLAASLVRHGALPIEASMNAIINDVQRFADGAPQSDDIACVLLGLRETQNLRAQS